MYHILSSDPVLITSYHLLLQRHWQELQLRIARQKRKGLQTQHVEADLEFNDVTFIYNHICFQTRILESLSYDAIFGLFFQVRGFDALLAWFPMKAEPGSPEEALPNHDELPETVPVTFLHSSSLYTWFPLLSVNMHLIIYHIYVTSHALPCPGVKMQS